MVVTIIDVGQGDAILVEFPNRKRLLVDTGPKSGSTDAGQRTVVPFLKQKGIEHLDAILLTHAHDDHAGGCRAVIENLEVQSLIVADSTASAKLYGEALEAARLRGVPIRLVRAGESLQFDPATRIFVLHPGWRLTE
jgi:competence protein ComEC